MTQKKENVDIKVDVNINLESIQSAFENSDTFLDAQLAIPSVDPKSLRLDDQVYRVTLEPITYDDVTLKPKEPNTAKYPAIQPITVNSLNKGIGVKEKCIIVNGTIDIPTETGTTTTLDNVYLTNEAQALALRNVMIRVQLNKLAKLKQRIACEENFIIKLQENDRY